MTPKSTTSSSASTSYFDKLKIFKPGSSSSATGTSSKNNSEKVKKLQTQLDHWEQRAVQAEAIVQNDLGEVFDAAKATTRRVKQLEQELSESRASCQLWKTRAVDAQSAREDMEKSRGKLLDKIETVRVQLDNAQKDAASSKAEAKRLQDSVDELKWSCKEKDELVAETMARRQKLDAQLQESNLRLSNIIRSPSVES